MKRFPANYSLLEFTANLDCRKYIHGTTILCLLSAHLSLQFSVLDLLFPMLVSTRALFHTNSLAMVYSSRSVPTYVSSRASSEGELLLRTVGTYEVPTSARAVFTVLFTCVGTESDFCRAYVKPDCCMQLSVGVYAQRSIYLPPFRRSLAIKQLGPDRQVCTGEVPLFNESGVGCIRGKEK